MVCPKKLQHLIVKVLIVVRSVTRIDDQVVVSMPLV
jgi:hypothetical protein